MVGANFLPNGKVRFRVWAPLCSQVEVKILRGKKARFISLKREDELGHFSAEAEGLSENDLYQYRLDGEKERPDPASRFQPRGVHGPSALVDPKKFKWHDARWKGIPFKDFIFYELHIGLFTPGGTFENAIEKIPYLKKLGITCVEIMPVAQFPGKRNWGYDGVGLFAVQNSYGGPSGLKKFVDACHRKGLAVCLDVVYNHFGPEGNYLSDFAPYFTAKYHTPWGNAINYDDAYSGGVRSLVIQNAKYWVEEYHIDALRLDAVHSIFDNGARHILEELNSEVQALAGRLGRQVHLIAESDLNDSKVIREKEKGGWGLAGQWSDDFHHAVHAYLTGERTGYYQDFEGPEDVIKALREGFVYDGKYSRFRRRRHGNPVKDLPPERLVVCLQNHDQIGNRAYGERLGALTSFENQKLAALLLLSAPQTPLLFMGQEYGETAPFQYFIDHEDPKLRAAVKEGRAQEFAGFGWEKVPDPGAPRVYEKSRLQWQLLREKKHAELFRFYRRLIALRKKRLARA